MGNKTLYIEDVQTQHVLTEIKLYALKMPQTQHVLTEVKSSDQLQACMEHFTLFLGYEFCSLLKTLM